jgi:aryl-alcohol dehydrogenase-like predicted oxidoreductase
MVYWPLMKGLLAGRLARDHQFHERDSRRNYPMYQGDEWQKNQDFVARLREVTAHVAASLRDADGLRGSVVRGSPDRALAPTVAQLVVNWTINQPGITSALCGAKRRWQIEELAGAMGWTLSQEQLAMIDAALAERGSAAAKRVFS